MEQVISKTELNNIRSSDKRLVSINDSGLCSTIISYVGALRIRDDALLYRPPRGKLVELKYPYSSFGSQSFVELKYVLKYLNNRKTTSCRKVSDNAGGRFRYKLFPSIFGLSELQLKILVVKS